LNDLFALLREVEAAIDAAGSVLSISQLQGSLANTVFGGGECASETRASLPRAGGGSLGDAEKREDDAEARE
jgi:hypothetical protein